MRVNPDWFVAQQLAGRPMLASGAASTAATTGGAASSLASTASINAAPVVTTNAGMGSIVSAILSNPSGGSHSGGGVYAEAEAAVAAAGAAGTTGTTSASSKLNNRVASRSLSLNSPLSSSPSVSPYHTSPNSPTVTGAVAAAAVSNAAETNLTLAASVTVLNVRTGAPLNATALSSLAPPAAATTTAATTTTAAPPAAPIPPPPPASSASDISESVSFDFPTKCRGGIIISRLISIQVKQADDIFD